MIATLTDRYLDAAMRGVPEAQRGDLAAELRASIDDQIEARVEAGDTPAAAEHAVLTALGDPDRLAARYVDRPLQLIGPRHFLDWWRLLRLLWAMLVPLSALGVAIGQLLIGASPGAVIGNAVSVALSVAVHTAFWVTLAFAFIERSTPADATPAAWDPDSLPEQRQPSTTTRDLVASLVMLALFTGVVVWDATVGLVPGLDVSFLHPALTPWWLAGLCVVLAAEALVRILAHRAGRWTMRLAVANALVDLGFAGGVVWLASQDSLINPAFFTALVPSGGPAVSQVVGTIVVISVVVVSAWDVIDVLVKARRRTGD